MNVIVVCHEKAMWKNGEQIGETFDGWDKMAYELDLTLQITKAGPQRRATVRKSRLAGFPDAQTFDWAYGDFADRYGRDQIESSVSTLVPATPDQVERLSNLMEIIKLDDGAKAKWLDKAGVDKFAEMDSETIQI